MSWGKKLNPFSPPDWLENLANAEIEASFGSWQVAAVKAMHVGIVMSGVVFTGVFLQGFKLLVGPNEYAKISWVALAENVTIPEVAGLLIFVWGSILGFKYLSEFLTRMLVQILGFSLSLQPGSIIRRYVYHPITKIWLVLLGGAFLVPYGLMWFYGLRGLIEFLVPRFALQLETSVFVALCLSWVAAFIIFPAMRIRIQDDVELLELLTFNELVISHKLHVKLRKEMLKIAAPQMARHMLEDLQQRGPEALGEWTTLPKSYWTRTAQTLGMPYNLIRNSKRLKYRPKQGGGYLIATESQDGTATVYDSDQFHGSFRPPEEEGDEYEST